MSSTRTAQNSTTFKFLRPGQNPTPAGIFGSRSDPLPPDFTETTDPAGNGKFSDLFHMSGIRLSPDEFSELHTLDEFLVRHVQPNGNCDVQCMLFWSEWIRDFRRRASGFPTLIREKEFQGVVMDQFGVGITTDGWRGAVYPGVRFIS